MPQTDKNAQGSIHIGCVDVRRIGRRERDVRRIGVMVRMVARMGPLGRRQQGEQLIIIVVFVWVVMVVPDEPKAWQRQPCQEEHHETQGVYTLMYARSYGPASQCPASLSE